MRTYLFPLFVALALVIGASSGPRSQPVEVEITDLKPTRVDYPKGPTVIVRNRTKRAGLEAWVIRHLDGVVVKSYQLPAAERWQEQLEIAPKGVALPGQVTATQTTVPFAVVVVAVTGQIAASASFDARVSSPKPKWPTAVGPVPKPLPFVASGEVVDMKKTNVTVKDAEGASKTYRLTDETTTWGGARAGREPMPSKGDSVTLIYTDQNGQGVVKQMAYRPPGELPNPWAPGPAYVGTVKGMLAARGDAFVLETTKFDGRWLIDTSTEKVFSPAVPSMGALAPGTLVGLRVKPGLPAEAPIPIDRLLVLTRAPSGG